MRVVYLPDPQRPRLAPADMRAAGVVVARDVDALLAAAETADAIMLDRSRLPELPSGWLMEQPQGLESIAACGFTVAGFIQAADLPRCAALGLRAILAPPRRPLFMAEEWSNLSDAALDQRVRETVRAGGGSPAVLGYFVMDEPGAQHFPLLGRVVAAFARHAPDALAYVNLYPNYALHVMYRPRRGVAPRFHRSREPTFSLAPCW